MKEEFKVSIDFSKYGGKYIAIVDRKIAASGEDAKTVWQNAKRKYPNKVPELMKVSRPGTFILILCR